MNVLQLAKYGSSTVLLKVDKFIPYQSNTWSPTWAPHCWLDGHCVSGCVV